MPNPTNEEDRQLPRDHQLLLDLLSPKLSLAEGLAIIARIRAEERERLMRIVDAEIINQDEGRIREAC